MKCRITGRLVEVGEQSIVLDTGPIAYEVLVPRIAADELRPQQGQEITLRTMEYLEGNPVMGQLVPRLVGFPQTAQRTLFDQLVRVKGMGVRKVLRAMAAPVAQIAAAIERGDERYLSKLPEIGKRTATQIVAELRGKLPALAEETESTPAVELTQPERLALDILVSWGDRRSDAEGWIAAARRAHPDLAAPEEIVRVAYRIKQGGGA